MRHNEDKVEDSNGFKFIRLKSGKLFWLSDALSEAQRGRTRMSTALSRAFKLVNADREYGADDLERIEWFLDDLETYVRAVRQEINRRRGNVKVEERIALMRNTNGRSPEEAALFNKKADELERGLEK